MSYIIGTKCISTCDTACVKVCPVDCINGPIVTDGMGREVEVMGKDELMGMQPDVDMMEMSAMQYKKGGRTEDEMDEYKYEREGIEHEMLEFEYKQRNGSVPNWFREMPLKYKRIIIKSKK